METQAEIGQFNERFWTDWHYRLSLARPDQTAPAPPKRMGKLRWCSRYGMKELDLLTLGYLEQHFPTAPAEEQQAFAALLELQAPLLMSYTVRRETPADATARVVGVMWILLNSTDGA